MASPASSETSEIRRRGRQRLIGAIALVLVLVVFVPMVLDSEPRREREAPAMAIPSRQNPPPLPEPPAAAPAPAPKSAAVTPTTAGTAAAIDAKVLAPEGKTPPAPPKAAAVAEPKAPALVGFAVQVGAFRDADKLRQARDKLAAAGVTHYTERLESAAGPLTRLRAGPFPTREAAESALAKLKRSALDGKVVPLE